MGARAHDEPRRVDPAGLERVELLEQHAEVDHDPVADHRGDPRGQDAAREQVQRVLLGADHDRVAGVVAAVELDHVVDDLARVAEQIGRLAFALIAPLGADEHDCGHLSPPLHAPAGTASHTRGCRRWKR
jgi:hypothetical protein